MSRAGATGKTKRGSGGVVIGHVLKSRRVRDFALMTLGIALVAWALDAFLIPNQIAAGGVSGLATVIYYWAKETFGLNLPVGAQMLAMNAVLLLIAWRVRGLPYVARILYGAVGLSVLVDVFARFSPALAGDDLLLAALYGGAITGLGLGLVFKTGSNTGGSDIIAQLLARKLPFGVGQLMLVVDATVTALAAFQFGPKLALYGAVAIFVASAAIDLVLEGVSVERAVWIITDQAETIGRAINFDLGRGATRLEATGVYTGERRGTIFVVVSRNEIDDLKAIVAAIDANAMVIISNVHEAIGEGFKEMNR
ncbi:MAG: YitT family protein [Coriobacteriia bacterium]|nr:YitT family protein [Coriobacteriia bacterium]